MVQSWFRGPVIALLALGLAACGKGDGGSMQRPPSLPSPTVLRTSCSESWWPTDRTFANPRWREQSVTAPPVTFLNAKQLARVRITGRGSVKIRTLVQPETPVTIAIGRSARGTAGFVAMTNAGEAGIDASRPVLHLAGCAGVPRSEQAIRGLADVGFPVFVAATKKSCVPMEITPDGGPTRHVVVSIGAGSCATG
jgi:hypothetical protein